MKSTERFILSIERGLLETSCFEKIKKITNFTRHKCEDKNMAQEIERKFLVKGDFKSSAVKSITIKQGYLNSAPERTVRIRIAGNKAYITIKGAGNQTGTSRFEWEKEIPVEEASELLTLAEPGTIEKTRYLVPFGDHVFEVDEFHGNNEGLIVAELELSSEDEPFDTPDWLGEEVTGDPRYYNSMLSKNSYKNNNS